MDKYEKYLINCKTEGTNAALSLFVYHLIYPYSDMGREKDCVIPRWKIEPNSKYSFNGFMNTIKKQCIESGKLISLMVNNYQLPANVGKAFSYYCFPTISNNPEFDYYVFRLLFQYKWISAEFPGMMAEPTYEPLSQYQQPRVNQWLKYREEIYCFLRFMGLHTDLPFLIKDLIRHLPHYDDKLFSKTIF